MNHQIAIKLRKIAEHYATQENEMAVGSGTHRWPERSPIHLYRQMKKFYLAGTFDLGNLQELYAIRVKGKPTIRQQIAAQKLQGMKPEIGPVEPLKKPIKHSLFSRLFK